MTDTQAPALIAAGPHPIHGWQHGGCSDAIMQSEDDTTYIRADRHAAVVAKRDQLKAEVQKLEEILHAHDFYRQQEEEAQQEEERQQLENLEMERHFREHPHG